MRLGIVGSEGVVGSACKFGFQKLGHEVKCHDLKLKTNIADVIDSDIIFITVPTPMESDGSCYTGFVEDVVEDIIAHTQAMMLPRRLRPIIAIKSTVAIGTTKKIQERHSDFDICFVPEFLKERSAIIDFSERQDLCVIGTDCDMVYEKIKEAHGRLPKKFVKVSPTEAELCKYFLNSFNAMRVVFANSFHELSKKYGADYDNIKNAMTNIPHIPPDYLLVNSNWRGYCGPCFSKDLPALNKMCSGTKVEFFKYIIEENEKYIKTVPDGMRMK